MNPEQVTFYIMRLPGVAGCFIVDEEGIKKASHLPTDFREDVIFGMANDGLDLMETFRAEMPGCQEIRMDVEGITILIRALMDHLLFVFIDESAELPTIRTGAKVCSKRYDPDGVEVAAMPGSMSEIIAKANYNLDS